ncbi:hypothetical protein [Natronosporangium hydrolyticum]|uniref:hypothetical protein n=1 Tax=Natronosporangium hydrolyticum TaxID=2811111 RepID=UPI001EFA2782|nr:hypothetical protein [Natronosporangium hydrolyticum]
MKIFLRRIVVVAVDHDLARCATQHRYWQRRTAVPAQLSILDDRTKPRDLHARYRSLVT